MTGTLPLVLAAVVAVAILITGTVLYLGHRGYRATVTVEPKIAPKPVSPEVTR